MENEGVMRRRGGEGVVFSARDDAFYSPSFVSPDAILNPSLCIPNPEADAISGTPRSSFANNAFCSLSKVLISTPPHHLRNLSRHSSLPNPSPTTTLACSPSPETRHSRERAVCQQPSFIDSTVEPRVASYGDGKRTRYPRKEESYGKPPIIGAVPLTQNKISARNVLYTLPSTGGNESEKRMQTGRKGWALLSAVVSSLPGSLIATFLSPPSSFPAPREPVSLLHANSIRGPGTRGEYRIMTPEGSRKKRRTRQGTRERRRKRRYARRASNKDREEWDMQEERECLETKVFPSVTTSLKRGIINIRSFLQIAPDMQDTSTLRAQEDI